MEPFDVLCTGRVGVDLYPQQIGVALAEVQTFAKYLGGSATNVAVQAARLGSRSAIVTKVGADGFGPFVRAALARFGVDARWVGTDPELRTPIVFCEVHPPDHFPLLFYRQPKAPDMNLTLADFDVEAVKEARLFWMTGTGLSDEPSRSTLIELLQMRHSARTDAEPQLTVLDLDYRPMFWESEVPARRWLQKAISYVSVVVGNEREAEVAIGEGDPRRAAAALRELGVELAIVKMGADGALAVTPSREVRVAPIRLPVVNGLGAGDAFGGALSHALVRGWPLHRALALANAAGAFAASKLACADDFGTATELEALLPAAYRS
jgi:5-dehydro-2-deoxygluconokinase